MAISRRGTRPITIGDITYHWKVKAPIANTDCPLCASWHIRVLTASGQLAGEFEVAVDPASGRPKPVTPGVVAAHLRDGVSPPQPQPAHRHERTATRQRHRAVRR